ncbi:MAG: DUF5802 family protein [Halobacteriaceae archaeon]
MFEPFSDGYYLGRMYVEPTTGDQTVMHRDQHERVNRQLYADGEGIERLDAPLVVKLDSTHLAVHGADDVPSDTLVVPETILADLGVDTLPSLEEVLLAKADRAAQLLRYAGT